MGIEEVAAEDTGVAIDGAEGGQVVYLMAKLLPTNQPAVFEAIGVSAQWMYTIRDLTILLGKNV